MWQRGRVPPSHGTRLQYKYEPPLAVSLAQKMPDIPIFLWNKVPWWSTGRGRDFTALWRQNRLKVQGSGRTWSHSANSIRGSSTASSLALITSTDQQDRSKVSPAARANVSRAPSRKCVHGYTDVTSSVRIRVFVHSWTDMSETQEPKALMGNKTVDPIQSAIHIL